jgi:hypothetical protein
MSNALENQVGFVTRCRLIGFFTDEYRAEGEAVLKLPDDSVLSCFVSRDIKLFEKLGVLGEYDFVISMLVMKKKAPTPKPARLFVAKDTFAPHHYVVCGTVVAVDKKKNNSVVNCGYYRILCDFSDFDSGDWVEISGRINAALPDRSRK